MPINNEDSTCFGCGGVLHERLPRRTGCWCADNYCGKCWSNPCAEDEKVMLWLAPNGEVAIAAVRPSERFLPSWAPMTPAEAQAVAKHVTRILHDRIVYDPKLDPTDPEVVAHDVAFDEAGRQLALFDVEVRRALQWERHIASPETCPACHVNVLREPAGRNALSRKDNATLICFRCGEREAIEEAGYA